MSKWSNEVILAKFRSSNDAEVNQAMEYLYQQLYTKVQGLVLKNSGKESEVADTFQEGLIAFFKLLRRGKIDDGIQVEAYVYSICRNIWLKTLRKRKKITSLSTEEDVVSSDELPLTIFVNQEQQLVLEKLLNSLGESCQQLLLAFYYERKRMKEIVQMLGYSNEQVAKNKKSKCMKKLREEMKAKNLTREFFYSE